MKIRLLLILIILMSFKNGLILAAARGAGIGIGAGLVQAPTPGAIDAAYQKYYKDRMDQISELKKQLIGQGHRLTVDVLLELMLSYHAPVSYDIWQENNKKLMYYFKQVEFRQSAKVIKEIKELIDSGDVDINTRNIINMTPLDIASEHGEKEIVELLLAHGATVDNEALIRAANKGYPEIVKILLNKGANVDARDDFGQTALMKASQIYANQYGTPIEVYLKIVEMLLDAGADINAKDNRGMTALMYAVSKGVKKIVEMLLSRGARVNERDNKGRTALTTKNPYYVSSEKGKELIKLLKSYGATE